MLFSFGSHSAFHQSQYWLCFMFTVLILHVVFYFVWLLKPLKKLKQWQIKEWWLYSRVGLPAGVPNLVPVKNVLLLGHFRRKKQKKAIQKKKRLQKVQNVMFSIVSEKKKKEKHKFHKYCVKVPKAKKKNWKFSTIWMWYFKFHY